MKIHSLVPLILLLPLTLAAQKASTSRVGEYSLDWSKGVIDALLPTPSGKATVTLTGKTGAVSLIAQETGGVRLTKRKLRSTRRELSAQNIIVQAQSSKQASKKTAVVGTVWQVQGARAQKDVTIFLEEIGLEGEKSTTKVRCDDATFKAGGKPGTGRLDFSGNARVWTYGAGLLESGEIATTGGWIDLGDPDDPENKPRTLHLEGGNSTGSVKDDGGGKKK